MTTLGAFRDTTIYAVVDRARWDIPTVNAWIRDAVRDYSSYFPQFIDTASLEDGNLECEQDVREYSLAAFTGIRSVMEVEYPEGEDPPEFLTRRDLDDPRGFYGLGVYDVRGHLAPDTLVIGPAPDDGEEIRLIYLANHANPETDADVLTVPEHHLEALTLFVQLRAIQAALIRLTTSPDFGERGETSMLSEARVRLANEVDRLFKAYMAKLESYRVAGQVTDGIAEIGAIRDRWEFNEWG